MPYLLFFMKEQTFGVRKNNNKKDHSFVKFCYPNLISSTSTNSHIHYPLSHWISNLMDQTYSPFSIAFCLWTYKNIFQDIFKLLNYYYYIF